MTDAEIQQNREMELVDYLLIFWKRKWMIILGTAVITAIAAVISFYMPRVYVVETTIRPGILGLDDEGENLYMDTAENLKSLITVGTFENDLRAFVTEKVGAEKVPDQIGFHVVLPPNSDTLKIRYETEDVDLGLQVLDQFQELLLRKYEKREQFQKNEYALKMAVKQEDIKRLAQSKQSIERKIKKLEERNTQLLSDINMKRQSVQHLVEEKSRRMKTTNPQNREILTLFYNSTIQQMLEMTNLLTNELSTNQLIKENDLQGLLEIGREISRLEEEKRSLAFKMDHLQSIEQVQVPGSNRKPVKPRIALNIVLAFCGGILLMITIVFFMEYFLYHLQQRQSKLNE